MCSPVPSSIWPLGGQSCPYKGADVLLSWGPSPLTRVLEVLQGWKLQEDAANLLNERWLHVALGAAGDTADTRTDPGCMASVRLSHLLWDCCE